MSEETYKQAYFKTLHYAQKRNCDVISLKAQLRFYQSACAIFAGIAVVVLGVFLLCGRG